MEISQYQYRYGQAVAFLIDGTIRFGNVATVITKQDKDGERTAIQVHVHPAKAEGEPESEPDRFLIPRGELIKSLDYPGHGNVVELAKHSEEYQRAKLREDAINNPVAPVVEPAVPPPQAAEPTGFQGEGDSSAPAGDEGAEDVPL